MVEETKKEQRGIISNQSGKFREKNRKQGRF